MYTEAINYWAQQTGFEADNWQWCFRYNSTYLDCPISQYANSTDFKFIVAVHNPANLPLTIPSIAVPHGHLSVQRFDPDSGSMVAAEAEVLCNLQQLELYPDQTVNNCWLYVNQTIDSNGIGFLTVQYDSNVDIAV